MTRIEPAGAGPVAILRLPGRLPRVTSGEAAASRRAARLLGGFSWRARIELGAVGTVALAFAGPGGAGGEMVTFGLRRGALAARLSLETTLAQRMIAAVIGSLDGPPTLRGLGLGERGVLAGVVAALLDRLGVDGSLSLAAPSRSAEAVFVAVQVTAMGHSGQALLEVPPSWLDEVARGAAWQAAAGALPVAVSIELAQTDLAAAALATLAPGDAVVFDGFRALGSDAASWPVQLVVGDYAAAATLAPEGAITTQERFHQARTPAGRVLKTKETEMSAPPSSADATAVLAAAPIEVIAELGRITLRGDELLGVTPGTILTFAPGRGGAVSLRVGGEVWAEGELVDVDGELGVRVTVLRRPAPPA